MTLEQLKPGTRLAVRLPFADGEFIAQFVEHLPSLGFDDPALNRVSCPDWVGMSGADEHGAFTFTDKEMERRARVLLVASAVRGHSHE
ncbi:MULTISPECIES: hypothetical protein [unclassified Pseudomonas]|uniref:hypothetical protein n=1 Tax=unclassified Pseudomonas TaxID=196821 RepID=UPI0011B83684|nr:MULTISPECIES: hypothetical protein [unclassified Pseudomonas]MDW3715317.1 hypothetical protein [Pseudomonas sp. 2023EL-01195]